MSSSFLAIQWSKLGQLLKVLLPVQTGVSVRTFSAEGGEPHSKRIGFGNVGPAKVST
jgi:hypothetical protein